MVVKMYLAVAVLCLVGLAPPSPARATESDLTVGTTLPADFPVIENFYLGVPIIGFGSDRGLGEHVPVIFVHGNNDSPFPTLCNPFGYIHNFAQFFLDHGYRPGDLWGVGYQGDQCDLLKDETHRSGVSHTTAAAVPILRQFVHAVMKFTGARRVDIVAHSLGVTVTREWLLQDNAYALVRGFVAVDGPNHGIINCSPSPLNFYQLPANGGFTPNSAVCDEYGSDHTQLLSVLNVAGESTGPTRYLVIRNVFRATPESGDFVYISAQDGPFLPSVPAEDRDGNAHDFSASALLAGAPHLDFAGEGKFDAVLGSAHLGLLNSPDSWNAALNFLNSLGRGDDD
jgi:pimeloyl-ACP methyl ester carboxylesterase